MCNLCLLLVVIIILRTENLILNSFEHRYGWLLYVTLKQEILISYGFSDVWKRKLPLAVTCWYSVFIALAAAPSYALSPDCGTLLVVGTDGAAGAVLLLWTLKIRSP
jgi:hypothetical protein